ncbi:MAG TPA: AAA family ATPase, partial [Paraburkholderia sp.]|nr:AAA family ATPase [Paraburkholderia sp.]
MLRHLSIRDFVIVAALDLEFDSGFTVFSGETGAGKSILIDALALALGARADASVVRTGETRADITAEFATHEQVEHWLDEQALATDADDAHGSTVMLRRVIDTNGRSRAFINGTPATLAQLRVVGEMLVDIHGQHAHQLLMRPDAQRELFDTHAGLVDMAAAVTRAWRSWRDAAQAVATAQARDRELQLERERLAWQLTELDKLAPQPGEWEEINTEHRKLSHSANLIDGVQGALNALSESDEAMI